MKITDALARRVLLAACAAALGASPLAAATPASPPVVEYSIEASLDDKAKVIEGKERLLWRNPSDDTVSELQFHLYLNAFKNNRSLFGRESGGRLRGDRAGVKPEDWGWIDVLSLATEDGRDLKPAAQFIHPDGVPWPGVSAGARNEDWEDETVLSVPLSSPVAPHGTVTLSIVFRSKLPKVFARTGYVRDFFLAGQWFPKIGVYEPAGMRGALGAAGTATRSTPTPSSTPTTAITTWR